MLEFGVMSCLCPNVGCWVVPFPGPGMWVVLPVLFCIVYLGVGWPVPRMWAVGSSLCCVIRRFLYRADALFPLFLGEVLSIFRLFWWPLASCYVPGYLLGSGILAKYHKLAVGS